MAIKKLPPQLAKKIAAGEIIERPYSVVKELLENSIDSGAKNITVTVEQGGKVLISIKDDGCGIAPDELPLAMENHATSKISTDEDLEAIITLGYRGEALSSVGAVSHMEIFSRQPQNPQGATISIKDGQTSPVTELPLMPGTTITVRDLFYNLPARRKFLKSAAAEFRRISRLVQDYALAWPEVSFSIINDGKKTFSSQGNGDIAQLLAQEWGHEPPITEESGSHGRSSIKIWWQDLGATSKASVTIFLNGRRITDATIRSALLSHAFANRGNWFLALAIPPEEIDVNIHPAKAEVLLRRGGDVFELVRNTVEQFGSKGNVLHLKDLDSTSDTGSFRKYERASEAPIKLADRINLLNKWQPSHKSDEPSRSYSSQYAYRPQEKTDPFCRAPQEPTFLQNESEEAPAPPTPDGLVYLGQLESGYIIFDEKGDLTLLDAHAAHERIIFEELMAIASTSLGSQKLLVPEPLPPIITDQIHGRRETLEKLGFSINYSGDLLSVPVFAQNLSFLNPTDLLRSYLEVIEEGTEASMMTEKMAMKACKRAVKLPDKLTPHEALQLMLKLKKCKNSNSCPHGRPTVLSLPKSRLERHFGRN